MLKGLNLKDFFRMMALMKNKLWLYLLMLMLACAINSTSNIVSAFVNKNMVLAAQSGSITAMKTGAYLVVLAFVLGCMIFPVCIFFKVKLIKQVIMNIRADLFKHIEKLPVSFHDRQHSGDTNSRLINDINVMESAYNDHMQIVGVSLLGGIGSAITMFFLDWRLSIVTILLGLASAAINLSYARPLREISGRIQHSLGRLNQYCTDLLEGFGISKIYNLGAILSGKFMKENGNVALNTMKRVRKNSELSSINYLTGILNLVGIYVIGSWMVINHSIEFSNVVAILTLQKGINFMFFNFGQFFAQLQGSLAGASRVFELLDQQEETRFIDGGVIGETQANSAIRFEEVAFGYDRKTKVLNDFSLSIPKGEAAALVGISGSGKSTVVKMMMGFYGTYSGTITIDGRLLGQYPVQELRERIAYVPQNAFLFSGTVEENLKYGKASASTQEMEEAARRANAHDFIMNLPNGYNTQIGEQGAALSGGQKQRIAIARAFLKDAPILLLDEATSSLDYESERLIQEALHNLMQERTTLIIAHRLSTLKQVQSIYVLDGGRIAECGTHDELMKRDGLYRKLNNVGLEEAFI